MTIESKDPNYHKLNTKWTCYSSRIGKRVEVWDECREVWSREVNTGGGNGPTPQTVLMF